MAQKIKQANIFGRIGSGIGKGLAEQVPKEIENYRLKSGLQELANASDQGNLSPAQFLAKASGTYGVSPQMVQSFGELANKQGLRNTYGKISGPTGRTPEEIIQQPGQPSIKDVRFANQQPQQSKNIPSGFANREEQAISQPGIVKENPTQNKFIPAIPWTPQQKENDVAREWDKNPNLTFEQAQAKSNDNEARFLAAPEAYRAQYDYLQKREEEADSELDKQLATSLQKGGDQIYSDLTGDTLLQMKKAMHNDLATNPDLTEKQAAEKWRLKGKDFAETKNGVRAKASLDLPDKLLPWKKEENLKSLISTQKKYAEMGALREYYNMLKTNNDPAKGQYGFGLSPGRAAMIAYPRSESLKNVTKNLKYIDADPRTAPSNSRKIAQDFVKEKTNNDSILAFMQDVKDKQPYFDQSAFMDYLRDNQDSLGLSPDQKKELDEGVTDFFPNWGDLTLFPITGRSKAND